jgi:hypothetical protein
MELTYRPCDEISMDFIVDLPVLNGCLSIWVVVDRFTKLSQFIPLKDGEKMTPDFVHIFLREIGRHHGTSSTVKSDRNTRFTSTIQKGIVDTLGFKSKMSSPFHLQTDEETESINQTLECYLRNYCNYEWDNWEEIMPMAECAFNNSLHSTV